MSQKEKLNLKIIKTQPENKVNHLVKNETDTYILKIGHKQFIRTINQY